MGEIEIGREPLPGPRQGSQTAAPGTDPAGPVVGGIDLPVVEMAFGSILAQPHIEWRSVFGLAVCH